MKKMNNRGFMLMETLIVATFLVTTLLFLYIQFNKVTKTYEDSFKYNTVNSLYATNNIAAYLKKEGMGKIAEKLNEQTYVDFTSCPKDFFKEQGYCQVLLESLKVEKALFTKADLTNIKTNHKGLDQEMVSFINYLKDTSSPKYRLIVKFQDGTFASINLNFCTFTSNSVFVISEKNPTIPDCITNNTTCAAGTEVTIKVNDSQTYDFYVISEDVSEGTITLIMNTNLVYSASWGAKRANDAGPVTILDNLENQTSSWINIPSATYRVEDEENVYPSMTRTARARLITKSEVSTLGCTTSAGSCPTWLYRYTFGNNSNNNPFGYWTSSASANSSYDAWVVSYFGDIGTVQIDDERGYGIRPVITISKNINTCS